MNFVMDHDAVVASVKGHSIAFKAGEATHVPPECVPEVISAGAVVYDPAPDCPVPESTIPADVVAEEPAVEEAPEAPTEEQPSE